jgi:hypothetical protein
MVHLQLLLDKRKEINEIFAAYGDFAIKILGSADPAYATRDPDVEILANLDGTRDDDIIVYATKTSQIFTLIRAIERHDFCMDVILKLRALLGCKVNVVDERGLETYYPVTYSRMHRS